MSLSMLTAKSISWERAGTKQKRVAYQFLFQFHTWTGSLIYLVIILSRRYTPSQKNKSLDWMPRIFIHHISSCHDIRAWPIGHRCLPCRRRLCAGHALVVTWLSTLTHPEALRVATGLPIDGETDPSFTWAKREDFRDLWEGSPYYPTLWKRKIFKIVFWGRDMLVPQEGR